MHRNDAMRETLNLKAEPRGKMGKGAAYRGRKAGQIPGIVYGGSAKPIPVQVDEHTLRRLHGTGAFLQTLVMLEIAGEKTRSPGTCRFPAADSRRQNFAGNPGAFPRSRGIARTEARRRGEHSAA